MPDFDSMLRERLAGLSLSREEQEEVLVELAGHLELCYAAEVEQGATEAAALSAASRQVGNWSAFRKQIQNTKGDNMRERLHRVWIPGVVVGTIFFMAQNALTHLRWPQIIPFHGAFISFDWLWIPMGILCGGCIAFWSRARGGSIANRISATLLPSGTLLAFFLVMTPIAMAIDHPASLAFIIWSFASFMSWLVVLPAVCMLLGALPFLRGSATAESETPLANATHA